MGAVHNMWDKEVPQPVSIESSIIKDDYEIMELLGEGAFGVVYLYVRQDSKQLQLV